MIEKAKRDIYLIIEAKLLKIQYIIFLFLHENSTVN